MPCRIEEVTPYLTSASVFTKERRRLMKRAIEMEVTDSTAKKRKRAGCHDRFFNWLARGMTLMRSSSNRFSLSYTEKGACNRRFPLRASS
ncbi:hypothetical protein KSS87_001888, partial [Heliosperma pusillum]